MGTKIKPGKFDCYEKAEPDEPMFVLLARDKTAALVVELWMLQQTEIDDEKLQEAKECAAAMRKWHKENRQL